MVGHGDTRNAVRELHFLNDCSGFQCRNEYRLSAPCTNY
ncbi:hypothetical protein BURPS305_0540 [Burkholderia pseudomallei 305]|nr:hypothetical protein BURPS305_0540 [Burkholderia pseudomallei 305]EEH25861.1 hypothetical protein BUH_6052 [Burkholderia pseudomallei Pakistan 9]